jgi:hypothetical protein
MKLLLPEFIILSLLFCSLGTVANFKIALINSFVELKIDRLKEVRP